MAPWNGPNNPLSRRPLRDEYIAHLDDPFEGYTPEHQARARGQYHNGDEQQDAEDDGEADQVIQPSRNERVRRDDVETVLDVEDVQSHHPLA